MEFQLVSHCWKYSRLLTYQLSSLILHPPLDVHVRMTVFYTPEDTRTQKCLEFFEQQRVPNVLWDWRPLERTRLMRRAIGRNLAARETESDWVWFTDCDMAFGDCTFDVLADVVRESEWQCVYPQRIWINRNHSDGDKAIEAVASPAVSDLSYDEFVIKKYRRAIGGVQIVRGDVARTCGYCPRRRWQRPAENWMQCKEDVTFRRIVARQFETTWQPIDLPHVYRLRHSDNGRTNASLEL